MQIEWDVTRYADRLPRKAANSGTKAALATEASLKRRYPPGDDSAAELPISRPCVIVDMQGIILTWYLPGILKDSRQVSRFTSTLSDRCIKRGAFQSEMMAATEKLHSLLGKRQSGAPWRVDPGNFTPGTENARGLLNMSPAWYQRGRDVSCLSL